MLKVEKIGSEMIRPASPTPPNLRFFNLSAQDLLIPPVFVHLIFYYPSPPTSAASSHLKPSLSRSLVRFYPLAGTLEYDAGRFSCDDKGVEFVETKVVGARLQDLLRVSLDERALNELIPCHYSGSKFGGSDTGADLLALQANFFDCGGLALAVSFRHSMCDMAAFADFLIHWATVSSNPPAAPDEADTRVVAYSLHLYPPPANPSLPKFVSPPYPDPAMKRFSFPDASIAALKKTVVVAGDGDDDELTRVEVITSLICRCMFRALTACETRSGKVMMATHSVNLRPRMNPPVADPNSFGNMCGPSFTAPLPESELTINGHLEKELRNSFKKVEGDLTRRVEGGEYWTHESVIEPMLTAREKHGRDGVVHCVFSSWCRFGLYEVDFGWGPPELVGTAPVPGRNMGIFVEGRGGAGVDAWVSLDAAAMANFQQDEELVEYSLLL